MGYGGHLGSSVQSNIMLKKPSFLLSSYSNAHCLYWSQSNSINTSTPHYSSRQHSSIGKSEYLRRCFATVRPEGLSQDQSDVFPWPKLSSRNRVPTPYEILCTEKGAKYTKKRFYELAKIYHPDRVGHANGSSHSSSLSGAEKMERYRLIVTAHEILSDVAKRSAYDASGAGWNGRPEHGIPKYNWGQNHETRWSGFDTNDSPFRNATWEDWERWYQRDKKKQEPVYFSNGGFLVLVIAVVSIGGFGQSVRVGDYANVFQRRVEKVHDDASKALRLRKQESAGFGNREERLQNFLKSRDPHGYGIIDPTEEGYRKLLPDPEVCMSEGTNTYLVGKGAFRILIDTGEGKPSWLRNLASVLASENTSISHTLITHWHPDHVGGIQDLRSICPDVAIHKYRLQDRSDSDVMSPIRHGQIFEVDGATFTAHHCPGHTTDHMGFVLKEEDAMFTGDNVLGHGTAVFEDLAVYLSSLHNMREHFKGRAYPGHGELIENGPGKIVEYIVHRQQREEELLRALKEVNKEATPMELVKVVYKDVPENLHEPAAGGVRQMLRKLEGEGKVTQSSQNRWQITGKAAL